MLGQGRRIGDVVEVPMAHQQHVDAAEVLRTAGTRPA
jgi:hypothetical protein